MHFANSIIRACRLTRVPAFVKNRKLILYLPRKRSIPDIDQCPIAVGTHRAHPRPDSSAHHTRGRGLRSTRGPAIPARKFASERTPREEVRRPPEGPVEDLSPPCPSTRRRTDRDRRTARSDERRVRTIRADRVDPLLTPAPASLRLFLGAVTPSSPLLTRSGF